MPDKKRTNAGRISLYGTSPEDALRRALNTPPPNRDEKSGVHKETPPKSESKKPKPKK